MAAKAGLWAPILSLFGPNSRNIRPNYLLIQRLSRAQHRSNEVVLEGEFSEVCIAPVRWIETTGEPKIPPEFTGKLVPLSRRVLPYRTGDLLTIHLATGEGHPVTYSHRSRRFDYGVHARTGEQTGTADLDSVVASERPEDLGVLGELLLGERRHHAPRIGQGHAESYRLTDRELEADPIVLDEAIFFGVDDNVHPEAPLVEAALGPKLAQLLEGGRRQDGHRKQVHKRTGGQRGRKTGLGEEGRAELLFYERVSVARWVDVLDVGMVLVDGEVIRRGPSQGDLSSEVC